MRIKKYHVKGHAYTQLIDENDFVHYVGKWNADALCICYHLIGWSESLYRHNKVRKYLKKHGFESEEVIKTVLGYYNTGLNQLEAPSRLNERIEEIEDRIDLLQLFMEEFSNKSLTQAKDAAWLKFQSVPKTQRKMMLEGAPY